MEILNKVLRSIKRIGTRPSLQILIYSLVKEYQDWKLHRLTHKDTNITLPGKIKEIKTIANGYFLEFENAQLELKFLAQDLLRVTWSPGKLPVPYAIEKTKWSEVEVEFEGSKGGYSFSSDLLQVKIDNVGNMAYFDRNDQLLRTDLPPMLQANRSEDQENHIHIWKHLSAMNPETHVYGMGERAHGFNLNPGTYTNWNRDPEGLYQTGDDPIYLCIPTYVAIDNNGSYLIFYENSFFSTFTFGRDQHSLGEVAATLSNDFFHSDSSNNFAEAKFSDGALRYYFIPGRLDQLLERYSELIGRPPLPPRWALGYHHSRWGYKEENDIRQVAEGFIQHNLPVSAIHLDIDYMQGYRVFTVDGEKFPDLSALVSDFDQLGIKLIPILDPGVKTDHDYFMFKEGMENGYFCKTPEGNLVRAPVWPGMSAFPDFTNPRVRNWWSEKYSLLLQQGVGGIWHDMNEPAAFSAWGDMSLPQSTIHDMDGKGGDHREAHNLYGLLMNRSGYESLLENKPKNRPWLLTRSGWASVARYAWTWTGDTASNWEALRQVIPTILGLSLSGIPYSGSDIGGFSGHPDPELYQRWFQMSTFTPFFRTHSSIESPPREPWTFDEATLLIIRKYLNLRYQLLPYLYTLAWEATEYGYPLIRPLNWLQNDNLDYWSIEDSFLLGNSLLIAPIMSRGSTSRKVVIPDGEWFDFWNDTKIKGPGEYQIEVGQDEIPVFVRAGCVLTLERDQSLHLHLYPMSIGEQRSLMYSDEGDGYGPSRIDYFNLQCHENEIELKWSESGDYPFTYYKVVVSIHGLNAQNGLLDGQEITFANNFIETNKFDSLIISKNHSP